MNYETTQDLNVQAINNINAPSLATSAVLVSLSRSVPDLVKNDPRSCESIGKTQERRFGFGGCEEEADRQ